jgi:hypothetical protein
MLEAYFSVTVTGSVPVRDPNCSKIDLLLVIRMFDGMVPFLSSGSAYASSNRPSFLDCLSDYLSDDLSDLVMIYSPSSFSLGTFEGVEVI